MCDDILTKCILIKNLKINKKYGNCMCLFAFLYHSLGFMVKCKIHILNQTQN